MTPHLTDEQVADYLSGESVKTTETHLAECAACRGEIDRLRASLHAFDQASMAWSEARIGSKPGSKPGRVFSRMLSGWRALAAGTLAAATAIAFTLLFTVHHRRLSADGNVRASNISDSTAEIERDNLLLRAIDEELDSLDLSPSKMYGISSSGNDPYARRRSGLRSTP
jgi:hypothetical protein